MLQCVRLEEPCDAGSAERAIIVLARGDSTWPVLQSLRTSSLTYTQCPMPSVLLHTAVGHGEFHCRCHGIPADVGSTSGDVQQKKVEILGMSCLMRLCRYQQCGETTASFITRGLQQLVPASPNTAYKSSGRGIWESLTERPAFRGTLSSSCLHRSP